MVAGAFALYCVFFLFTPHMFHIPSIYKLYITHLLKAMPYICFIYGLYMDYTPLWAGGIRDQGLGIRRGKGYKKTLRVLGHSSPLGVGVMTE
jgi:hypothetical protein